MPRDRWVPCPTLNQTLPPSAYPPPSPRPSQALPHRISRVSSPFEPSSAIPRTTTRATSNNKRIARQDHIKVIYPGSLFSRLVWCPHRFLLFFFSIILLSFLLLIFSLGPFGTAYISACFNPNASTASFLLCPLLNSVFLPNILCLLILPSSCFFYLSLRYFLLHFVLGRATSDCKQVCSSISVLCYLSFTGS